MVAAGCGRHQQRNLYFSHYLSRCAHVLFSVSTVLLTSTVISSTSLPSALTSTGTPARLQSQPPDPPRALHCSTVAVMRAVGLRFLCSFQSCFKASASLSSSAPGEELSSKTSSLLVTAGIVSISTCSCSVESLRVSSLVRS